MLSDSSTWDAIDFDAIDAAVISTSHRQEQTNGNVIMNQSGGVMLAERTTEQQLVSPSETNVSEKRTARVGHRFDGELLRHNLPIGDFLFVLFSVATG